MRVRGTLHESISDGFHETSRSPRPLPAKMRGEREATSAAVGFDHLTARCRKFRLVLLEARAHLLRLADVLRAERFGIGAAGHLLLHARTRLRRGLRKACDHEG